MFFEGAQTHWDQPREPPGPLACAHNWKEHCPPTVLGPCFHGKPHVLPGAILLTITIWITSGSTFFPLAFWRV